MATSPAANNNIRLLGSGTRPMYSCGKPLFYGWVPAIGV
jgi:hypothetical protein